jgi:DNA processing protein
MAHRLFSDSELRELTNCFQPNGFDEHRALKLASAVTVSLITEPGDRMATALSRILGRANLVALTIDGLDSRAVLNEVEQQGARGELEQLFGDVSQTLEDSRQRWLPRLSKLAVVRALQQARAMGLDIVVSGDEDWPNGLYDLQDGAPSLLFVQGQKQELSGLAKAVSIVGSRQSTDYGLTVTQRIVRELALQHRPTVSGGAIGIDSHAHTESVRNALPTVAVMAGGLDRKYPKSNYALFAQIAKCGAVISELPPGIAPTRWRFLQRNRLIAALSPVTVVVEANFRSGSIRTANMALELDRELYAVPGSILSGTSNGTNNLIAEGKARPLVDTKLLVGEQSSSEDYLEGSEISKRAFDALREIRSATKSEIARVAGLTETEASFALEELLKTNQLIRNYGFTGSVHYALKYGFRT